VTGDPFHPDTQQGAQVSELQYKRIMEYVEIGKKEARLLCGGGRKGDKGYFIEPTIFADVKKGHKVTRVGSFLHFSNLCK
jgi:aldehyde dehydrogenase (NAD+)